MKPEYRRENLQITEFDSEDVITTSGIVDPTTPEGLLRERENAYYSYKTLHQSPGSWF